jgi:hypothetical protein
MASLGLSNGPCWSASSASVGLEVDLDDNPLAWPVEKGFHVASVVATLAGRRPKAGQGTGGGPAGDC